MLPTAPLSDASRVRSVVESNPYRVVAVGLAIAAGLAVFILSNELFPYHSSNHDEGVYLQQAAMLVEGQLVLSPGSEALRQAFRPWFFVKAEHGLYPKYAPVPAVLFALGKLTGGYRVALGAMAFTNVLLTYALTAAAFDRRTGVGASAIIAVAPLFVVTSAVFLPYAPTTALNLVFAVAYVRSHRQVSVAYAAIAGAAIGLSFFARPFTAVLFAAPFVGHTIWRLSRDLPRDRALLRRTAGTAGVGSAFVGLTLAYNALVTGSALLFPYEAFAPLDGIGFGRRAVLGHEVIYTPTLAVRAAAVVLWTFATDWFTAGLVGTAAAVVGGAVALIGIHRDGLDRTTAIDSQQIRLLLFGIVLSVVVGNLLFWGNLNILDDIGRPGDGLINRFGPFYHFDLLVPLAAFAAHGVVVVVARARKWSAAGDQSATLVTMVVLGGAVGGVVVAEADVLGPPLERNAAYTEKYDRAYAPFRAADHPSGLVFLPPAYGPWLNHPFQWLRNAPGFDGPTVYALTLGPESDFAVLDAYPERSYYRYRYHGVWTPDPTDHVIPVLEPIRRVEGDQLTARTTVAVPERIVAVSVAFADDETIRRYDYTGEIPTTVAIDWTLRTDGVAVDHPRLEGVSPRDHLRITGPQRLALTVTLTEPGGATLTYREEILVRPTDTGLEGIWPPATTVCPLVTECGMVGTYLPDRPDTRPRGIEINTTIREAATAVNSSRNP